MNDRRVALTDLCPTLQQLYGSSPGYRRLYSLILDGKIPAQRRSGRLSVGEDDLPRIAEILGLSAPDAEPLPGASDGQGEEQRGSV
jgi:hypothetical protein